MRAWHCIYGSNHTWLRITAAGSSQEPQMSLGRRLSLDPHQRDSKHSTSPKPAQDPTAASPTTLPWKISVSITNECTNWNPSAMVQSQGSEHLPEVLRAPAQLRGVRSPPGAEPKEQSWLWGSEPPLEPPFPSDNPSAGEEKTAPQSPAARLRAWQNKQNCYEENTELDGKLLWTHCTFKNLFGCYH